MASRTLEVRITGDASGAKRAFSSVDKQASDTDDTIRSKMSASSAAIGAAAIAGVAAVGYALKGAWDAAEESAKIGRETQRVIESTGASVWTSGDQIGNFADKLSMATGVDDELIQSGENLLLTFTNVRNAFGEGNQVFDDGARLALDMSTVLGTDLNDATLQVGKALNDPIRGITALRRAGVSFTKQQEDQIKKMVESGDVLGAQKVIIGELSKEFGGAAAAAATPLDKLKVTVGNLQEKIGKALIPVVAKASKVLSSWITWLEDHQDVAKYLAVAIGVVLVTAIVAYTASMVSAAAATLAATWPILAIIAVIGLLVAGVIYAYNNIDWFRTAVDTAWDAIQKAVSWAWEKVIKPAWDAMYQFIQNYLIPWSQTLWDVAKDVWDKISGAVSWAWSNVIKPIWDAYYDYVVNYLIPAAQWLWDKIKEVWDWIGDKISAVWESVVRPAFEGLYDFVVDKLYPAFDGLYSSASSSMDQLGQSVSLSWNSSIKPTWDTMYQTLEGVLTPAIWEFGQLNARAWGIISGTVSTAWNSVMAPILSTLLDIFLTVAPTALKTMQGVWSAVWTAITFVIGNSWNIISGYMGFAYDAAMRILPAAFDFLRDKVAGVWNYITWVVGAAWGVISTQFGMIQGGIDTLKSAFQSIRDTVSNVFNGLAGPIRSAFQSIKDAWNNTVGGRGISIPGFLGFGGVDFEIPRMHTGGIVPGPPGSEVLRILQAGELVVPRNQVGSVGGGGMNITINMPAGSNGEDVVNAIRRYEQRNGTGWRN